MAGRVRETLSQVLHRRMAVELLEDVTEVFWTVDQHWGWCGQNCPCCRSIHREALGMCAACETADQAALTAARIAAFLAEDQCTKAVIAGLTGKLGPRNRPLPSRVMTEIGEMLPEILGTVATLAGLAGIGLMCGGDDW